MPDEQKPKLRQLGPNSYSSGGELTPRELGGNRFKAALGLKTAPWEALVSQETVDVLGSEDFGENIPNQGYPLDQMADIYLGTPTQKPSGTWLPPKGKDPVVSPILKPLWEKVLARHPEAGRFVEEVRPYSFGEMKLGEFGAFQPETKEVILDSTTDENTLLHELGHAAQYAAFPEDGSPEAYWKHHLGQGSNYLNQRGEITSRMIAKDEAEPFHDVTKVPDLKALRARKEALIQALYGRDAPFGFGDR